MGCRHAACKNRLAIPACDVFKNGESLKIVAEVPGVKPEGVKISLENNVLVIHLPGTVDADRIQARYQNGVLTVTLPRVERA